MHRTMMRRGGTPWSFPVWSLTALVPCKSGEQVALLGVSVTCYIRWELPPPWHVHQVECSYNRFEIISILPTNLSYKLGDLQQKISRAITCTVYNTHNTVSTRSLSFYIPPQSQPLTLVRLRLFLNRRSLTTGSDLVNPSAT